jgi:hypothetical protein
MKSEESDRVAKIYAERVHVFAKELEKKMKCFCDLDRWEPERITGHSWVCPIHKKAMSETPK